MDDSGLIEMAKALGWKTYQGRWWTDQFDPAQNTWTWDRVKEELLKANPKGRE